MVGMNIGEEKDLQRHLPDRVSRRRAGGQGRRLPREASTASPRPRTARRWTTSSPRTSASLTRWTHIRRDVRAKLEDQADRARQRRCSTNAVIEQGRGERHGRDSGSDDRAPDRLHGPQTSSARLAQQGLEHRRLYEVHRSGPRRACRDQLPRSGRERACARTCVLEAIANVENFEVDRGRDRRGDRRSLPSRSAAERRGAQEEPDRGRPRVFQGRRDPRQGRRSSSCDNAKAE